MSKPDLADLIVTERNYNVSWLDKITPELRTELEAVRAAFKQAGGMAYPTARNVVEHFGLEIGATTVARWLKS